jgi:hypothetical protein
VSNLGFLIPRHLTPNRKNLMFCAILSIIVSTTNYIFVQDSYLTLSVSAVSFASFGF